MICRKCKKPIDDDSVFCKFCGARQEIIRAKRQRPNGTGTAWKRGRTWTAVYVNGYIPLPDGSTKPDPITLGGFLTRTSALDFVPVLKASSKIPKSERNSVLRQAKSSPSIADALRVVENYRRKVPGDLITFKALYDRWLPFYEQVCKDVSTMNGHKAAVKHFKELWSLPFAQLSADDLQEAVDNCPRGKKTKQNMHQLAKRLYEYAMGRKIVPVNYADYIYVTADGNSRRAALKPEHVVKIRGQIGKYRFAEYIYCLCYLGFRPNEMLQLTKDAYHHEDGVEYLVGGFKSAAGTDRAVTIAPQIAPIIRELVAAPGPYIFPGPDGEMIDDEYLREKIFYPLLESLGIQPYPTQDNPATYVPYSCRHFFSDLLKYADGAEKDKAALIGHSDYDTTVRVYQSEDLKAMQRITNSFE